MYIVFTEFAYDGVEPMVAVELFDDLRVAEQYYNNEKVLCGMALESRGKFVSRENTYDNRTDYVAYISEDYNSNHVHIRLERKEVK